MEIGNHFILPRDSPFMVDMLRIDNENLKEEDQDFKYHDENESFKVKLPPNMHGTGNIKFYTNEKKDSQNCADETVSEMIVPTRVENLSVSEEVYSCQNSFANEEEVDQMIPFSGNDFSSDDNDDVTKEMKEITPISEMIVKEYHCIDEAVSKAEHSEITVPNDGAEHVSVSEEIDTETAEKFSCASSSENEEKPDTSHTSVSFRNDDVVDDKSKIERYYSCIGISDEVTEPQLLSSEDLNKESLQEKADIQSSSTDQKLYDDKSKNYQVVSEESKTTPVSEDTHADDRDKETVSPSKVPSGVITFTFDPKEKSKNTKAANKDDKNTLQQEHAHIVSGNEGASFNAATISPRTSFLHLMQGDSNFHGPGFMSGPIANSGHIAYSGSISLRSDSSTTSARSFAFPILHSEWNSSPVKMAKARRRGRKIPLLCCKF